ncbi:retrovirus-related pol polyprotein from transposon TNT 1-94, partial [Tanacetum coccineum]
AVVRLLDPKLKTLGERCIECIFVKYDEHSKAFRLYVIESNESVLINSIIESRDAIFDENRFSSVLRPSLRIPTETENIGASVVPKEVTEENDPKTFDKAMKSQDIFKRKLKVDETIEKFKARLVIHGFRQKSGIDYFDTDAPNGELDEDVYTNQPQGCFIMPSNKNKVCKLIKSLYELKQVVSQLEYSRVIGCLMHAMTCTSPDIAFAVSKLSMYTSNPGTQHWQAIQWLIRNMEDNSSTSGWVFLLSGGAISWAFKKQTCITGSTMKSEFIALATAGKEAEWLKNLLLEILDQSLLRTLAFSFNVQEKNFLLIKGYSSKNYVRKFLRAHHPKLESIGPEASSDGGPINMGGPLNVQAAPKVNMGPPPGTTPGSEKSVSFQKSILGPRPKHIIVNNVRVPVASDNEVKQFYKPLSKPGVGFSKPNFRSKTPPPRRVINNYHRPKTPQPKRNIGRQNQPRGFPICLGVDLEPDEWIKDSGCSKHMTGNRKLFSSYKAYNGGNVIFGSNLRGNIIGKGQICDNKCRVTFSEHDSEITKDGKVIGRGIRKKGLYVMKLGNEPKDKICLATIDENSTLWHRRLGHANMRLIQSLASKELVRNLPKLKFDQHFCDACKIGKQAHASHKAKNIVSTTKCLELLHMDLYGVTKENRYTLVIVDDYSRYTWTRFLKDKIEAFDQFKIFSKKIQNQLGCTIVSIRTDHGREFDNEVQFGEFGYSQNSKAYIILKKHTRKVKESLNVTFDETPPPSKTSPLVDDDLDEQEAIKVTEKKNLESDIVDETLEIDEIVNIKKYRNHPLENVIGNLNQRTLRSQAQNQSNFFCFISTIELKNVNEALTDDSWIVAMQEKLNQFIANDVWELVPKPRNMKIIGTKWVFRNKLDENGIVSRNKARLVAQGYNQQEGIDYDETYAPVARLESIRILLAYACALGFKLFQMDVKYAFLNGFINEEKSSNLIIVQIYVDDIIFGSTCQDMCDEFTKIMHDEFEMSMMGELNFFLRLQIKQMEDGIFFNQSKYIKEMLKKFGLEDSKPMKTPMSSDTKLTKDEECESVDSTKYRGMIGSLLYLMASRPDIMFSVCLCARFQEAPKTSHLEVVKRIFRYIKGTTHLGLWYPKGTGIETVVYADSDHAGDYVDRKSTSGICTFVGCCLTSWFSKKQTALAISTTEAEYVTLRKGMSTSTMDETSSHRLRLSDVKVVPFPSTPKERLVDIVEISEVEYIGEWSMMKSIMGEPLSPDRVFDFPVDELEPHPAYDFFAPRPLPGYAGNLNNNNGWIEADVPLLRELGVVADEPMVGLIVDEIAELIVEVEEQVIAPVVDMDKDIAMLFGDDDFEDDDSEGFDEEEVWEVNKEWLMAPVTPPLMPVVPPPSIYEVGGPSTAAAKGQSFPLPAPGLPVPPSVSDAEVAAGVTIREIGPRVFAIEGQVQVMTSQMVHAEDIFEQIGTQVEQGQQTATHRDEVIARLTQQVHALQAEVQ